MNAESKDAILGEIDAILRAIGQKDYEQFRLLMRTAAILFENAAIWSNRFAATTRKDLEEAIENTPDAEAETKLRLMAELRNYLPTLGTKLVQATTQVFPPRLGGAPRKLKDRDAERQACSMVLGLIAGGKSEHEAKKIAAKKLDMSHHTMNRRWAERTIIMQPSIEEFLGQLFKLLITTNTPSTRASDGNPPELPRDDVQISEQTQEKQVTSSE